MCLNSYNSNKKSFINSPSMTCQELEVIQLLQYAEIPFSFQRKFQLNDRYYILDFFIKNSILLECSFTSMYKVDVALKLKALQLEAKFIQLKKKYDYSFWVLFETIKPINTHLLITLQRLMPSVDRILTSCSQLREDLTTKEVFSNFSTSLNFTETPSMKSIQINPTYSGNSIINSVSDFPNNKASCFKKLNLDQFDLLSESFPVISFSTCNFPSINYSHLMKKEFFGDFRYSIYEW